MHSSRMRTARALTVSPSMLCVRGVPPPGGASSGGPPPGGSPRGVSSGGGGEGCLLQGGLSQHALRQAPPVNRMTNRCKNITLGVCGP